MSKKQKTKTNSQKTKNQGVTIFAKSFWSLKNTIILSVSVLIVASLVYYFFIRKTEPHFVKGGELTFIKAADKAPLKKIDIEVAITPESQVQGMMYRTHNEEADGMLFIMAESGMHKFWMKDTYIPLDIAFVDSIGVIDTIYRNAKPLSERSLPSRRRVQYVVETNGGFSDKFGIKEGDLMSFKLVNK